MATVSKLPNPGVVLDLDSYEREPDEVEPPFVVKVGDKEITFKDPAEIEWDVLALVDHPGQLLRVSLSREDREHINKQKLPSHKFNKLMEAYYNHYGLEDKILKARQQAKLLEV